MAFYTKAFIHHSRKDCSKAERMALITKRLEKIEEQESLVNKELQEYLESETNKAVSALSGYLKSSDVEKQFAAWTLDDVPVSDDSWELMTTNCIQTTLMKRLKEVIKAWEKRNHVFANARTTLIQLFQERFNFVEGQLRNLESSVLAEDDVSHGSAPQGTGKSSRAEQFINYIVCFHHPYLSCMVLFTYGVATLGTTAAMKKWEDLKKTREFKKDKCRFMATASKEYLSEAVKEENLRTFVVEQLKECHVCLKHVVTRIPELINADKMLFLLLRKEKRSSQEIEHFFQPLCQRSLELRERMAVFCINEVRTMDISRSDLEWNEDRSSFLGKGSFGSVFRGKLKQQGEEQPVALKFWQNEFDASVFLVETETLR